MFHESENDNHQLCRGGALGAQEAQIASRSLRGLTARKLRRHRGRDGGEEAKLELLECERGKILKNFLQYYTLELVVSTRCMISVCVCVCVCV